MFSTSELVEIKVILFYKVNLVIVAPIAVNSSAYIPSSHIFFFLRQKRSFVIFYCPFMYLQIAPTVNILSHFVYLTQRPFVQV